MTDEKYEVVKEGGHFIVRYNVGIKGLYNTTCKCDYKNEAENVCALLNHQLAELREQ